MKYKTNVQDNISSFTIFYCMRLAHRLTSFAITTAYAVSIASVNESIILI